MLSRMAFVIGVNLSRKEQACRRPEGPGQTIDRIAVRVVGRHSTMPTPSCAASSERDSSRASRAAVSPPPSLCKAAGYGAHQS